MAGTSDRLQWVEAPDELKRALASLLGSEVVAAAEQHSGFSPGLAVRVRTADGAAAFVKAAPESLGASASLYRREAGVLGVLPTGVPAPRLLGSLEAGEWFALVAEEIDGRHPAQPPSERDLVAVLDVIAAAPEATGLGLPSLADGLPPVSWSELVAAHGEQLSAFERANVDRLEQLAMEAHAHLEGDRLVHLDTRSDNVLIDAGGAAWLIDWSWGSVGAPWIDALCLLLDARMGGARDPERFLQHDALAEVPARAVDALLAALAAQFRLSSLQPAPPRMPALRRFQAMEADAALDWLTERWEAQARR